MSPKDDFAVRVDASAVPEESVSLKNALRCQVLDRCLGHQATNGMIPHCGPEQVRDGKGGVTALSAAGGDPVTNLDHAIQIWGAFVTAQSDHLAIHNDHPTAGTVCGTHRDCHAPHDI